MNITVTLIVQMLVFMIFVWVVMKFIWPIILGAMNEREKKIAAGLAAAEQGHRLAVLLSRVNVEESRLGEWNDEGAADALQSTEQHHFRE